MRSSCASIRRGDRRRVARTCRARGELLQDARAGFPGGSVRGDYVALRLAGVARASIPLQPVWMKPRVPGTSLVEALVALCVFSIGSACSAAWLMWSFGEDAKSLRSVAATAATSNLIERMRSNPEGLLAGHYRAAASASTALQGLSPASSPCSGGCTAAGRAADDIARFRASLATWMGDAAEGSVMPRPDGTWRIAITWRGRNELEQVVRP